MGPARLDLHAFLFFFIFTLLNTVTLSFGLIRSIVRLPQRQMVSRGWGGGYLRGPRSQVVEDEVGGGSELGEWEGSVPMTLHIYNQEDSTLGWVSVFHHFVVVVVVVL